MKRVHIDDIKEDMVIAANVYEPSEDLTIPLVKSGIALNNDYINRLKHHGIVYVYIEIPKDYKGSPGETIELQSLKEDFYFEGRLKILDGLQSGIKVDAREKVSIEGEVMPGCFISCAEGSVTINGIVSGSKSDPVQISSGGNIVLKNASNTSLKSRGDIRITGSVIGCTAISEGDIEVRGDAENSHLYSHKKIHISGSVGNNVELAVNPGECQQIFQELLKMDYHSNDISKEMEKIKNIIDLVRKLGKNIDNLPQEKRFAIALDIKRHKELQSELIALGERKKALIRKNSSLLDQKRIFVLGAIETGTKLTIMHSTVDLNAYLKKKAFHVKDDEIIATDITN